MNCSDGAHSVQNDPKIQYFSKAEYIEDFVPVHKLPSFREFDLNLDKSGQFHYLIIFEDLQTHLRGLSVDDATQLSSYLTSSRHNNTSIIYIMHNLGMGVSKNRFDTMFTGNACNTM